MRIDHRFVHNNLQFPFTTSHRTIKDNLQLLVRLKWKNHIGLGTGLLSYSVQEVEAQKKGFLNRLGHYQSILENAEPFDFVKCLKSIQLLEPSAIFEHQALDLALHDLLGKALGQPIFKVFGLADLPLPLSGYSLSSCENIEGYLRQITPEILTYPILKLKMTSRSPLNAVSELRKIYPGRIWVDVNEGWTLDQARKALVEFEKSNVEILEQPLKRNSPDEIMTLKSSSPIKIYADEDCTDIPSLLALREIVDGVAIKLHKCGGLSPALTMIKLAKELGLGVMLGCRTENAIGISAISQLAGLADHLDLDGALTIVDDPFKGTKFESGKILRTSYPGLGVIDSGKQ